MNKQEFLSAFQRAMESLGVRDQAAHYGFFEELFSDMGEEGISEEEISARLGDPWELAASLLREEGQDPGSGRRESFPAGEAASEERTEPGEQAGAEQTTWEKTWNWRNGIFKLLRQPGKLHFNLNIGSDHDDEFETRIPSGGIEELEINWRSGELTVEAEDREDILLIEDRDVTYPPLRTEVRGKCLYVFFAERPCGSKDLEVRLPTSLAIGLSRCAVSAISADVSLSGLDVGRLTVNSTSGNQEIRLMAEQADFSSASGDLELTVEAKEMTVSTASGDISLANLSGRNVKLSTASGDIGYRGKAEALTLNTASGDMEFSGEAEQIRVKTASGDCYIVLENCPQSLSVTSVSGDVDVELPGDCACHLQLQSRSGDIHFSGIRTDVDNAPTYHFNTVSGDIDVHC